MLKTGVTKAIGPVQLQSCFGYLPDQIQRFEPVSEEVELRKDTTAATRLHRSLLEKDVQRLKKQLEDEVNLQTALKIALGHPGTPLESIRSRLPTKVQELLNDVALLEASIMKLEEQVISLRIQVKQLKKVPLARIQEVTASKELDIRHESFLMDEPPCQAPKLPEEKVEPPVCDANEANPNETNFLSMPKVDAEEQASRWKSPKHSKSRHKELQASPKTQSSPTSEGKQEPFQLGAMLQQDRAHQEPRFNFYEPRSIYIVAKRKIREHLQLQKEKVEAVPKLFLERIELSPKVSVDKIGANKVATSPKVSVDKVDTSFKVLVETVETPTKVAIQKIEVSPKVYNEKVESSPKVYNGKVESGPKVYNGKVESSPKVSAEKLEAISNQLLLEEGSQEKLQATLLQELPPSEQLMTPLGELPTVDISNLLKKRKPGKQRSSRIAEKMLQSMINIYQRFANSTPSTSQCQRISLPAESPKGRKYASISESSLSFFSGSPLLKLRNKERVIGSADTFDPYRTHEKLPWKDIGTYATAVEVSLIAAAKEKAGYISEALSKYRLLVKQLEDVNPIQMSHVEKLAFWINLYNALMMDAYLTHGIPKNDIKFVSMIEKTSYNVGGQSVNALSIECGFLKGKTTAHRPQLKYKLPAEQKDFSIDHPEPLTVFALSCGAHSSPAVQIFAPDRVQEQLLTSLRDYVRASVGISVRGKLLVPKLLYAYARDVMDDSAFTKWLCQHLPNSQVAAIQDCSHQRNNLGLWGSKSFTVLSFDFQFRYLLLARQIKRKQDSF